VLKVFDFGVVSIGELDHGFQVGVEEQLGGVAV